MIEDQIAFAERQDAVLRNLPVDALIVVLKYVAGSTNKVSAIKQLRVLSEDPARSNGLLTLKEAKDVMDHVDMWMHDRFMAREQLAANYH